MKMQKRQFRIGQLAENLGVERFVVRFWEREFKLACDRSDGGQRFYDEQDLALFKAIKELLYDKGFTISGAKKQLKDFKNTNIIASHKTTMEPEKSSKNIHQRCIQGLNALKEELLNLKKNL